MSEPWYVGKEHSVFILTRDDAIAICGILEKDGSEKAVACKTRLLFQWPKPGEWKK